MTASHGNKKKEYRRLLVTGSSAVLGTGFKNVRSEFPEREFIFLSSADGDLTREKTAIDLVAGYAPDVIIHLAALSGGIGYSLKHPARLLRDNVLMTLNIMEAARLRNVAKTVLTLSAGMYPEKAALPLREDAMHDGVPHSSNYSYAFAKRLVDPALRAYRAEYGMHVIGLIPNGILGENDCFNYDEAAMVPALIRRFYENRDTREPIVIWGDGTPLREYTDARDLARAYMWAVDHYNQPDALNIGSAEEHSVKEIALMIAECLAVDPDRIVFDTTKPEGIHRKNTDNSRFRELSGFTYTSFRKTLQRTIDWFCMMMMEHPEALRLSKTDRTERNGGD